MASGIDLHAFSVALGFRFAMTDIAASEAMWLHEADDTRTPVHLARDRPQWLEIVTLTDVELGVFVELARLVDDGEAATIAAAASRGLRIATDDRKAIRVAEAAHAPVQIVGTTTIIRLWSDSGVPQPDEVSAAIQAIRLRASFVPRRQDEHFDWWNEMLAR